MAVEMNKETGRKPLPVESSRKLGGAPSPVQLARELSKRERQIMDIIYRLEQASAGDVHALLPDRPSYTGVRGLLRVLERKGMVLHHQEGQRFIYRPTISGKDAATAHLMDVVRTFFHSSSVDAIAAILTSSARMLRENEIRRLQALLSRVTVR